MSFSIIINAIVLSSLYAVLAVGFTLIFGVGGVLNLAHGSLLTLGAFSSYYLISILGYNIFLGLLAGMLVPALVGGAIYSIIIKRIEGAMLLEMVLTLLIGITIEHVLRLSVTHSTITIPVLLPGEWTIYGYRMQKSLALIFMISWIVIVALYIFVEFSKKGRAIKAISMSGKGAQLVGIDKVQINFYTWVIASGFAGLAGVLLLSFQTGDWRMGTDPLIISFVIVIIGGLGSVRGSIVGAYIIGTMETITVSIIDPRLTGMASFVLVVIMLMIKPSGLFGRESVSDMIEETGLF